jgi:hypothetical protein
MALARPDVSEERITSIIRVTRTGKLGTLAVTSNRSTLRRNTMKAIHSFERLILARATWCNIQEDGIFHILFVYQLQFMDFNI